MRKNILLVSILVFSGILFQGCFQVTSTSPANGATNVDVRASISVTLNQDIDPSTVTSTTFALESGSFPVIKRINGNRTVDGNTMTFYPSSPLEYNTKYSIIVSVKGLKSTSGEMLKAFPATSFTTKGTNSLEIVSVNPDENEKTAGINDSIEATFSSALRPSTINSNSIRVLEKGQTQIAGSVSLNNTTVIFRPASPMKYGTVYRVYISSSIVDINGRSLANDYTYIFTTRPAAGALDAGFDSDGQLDFQFTNGNYDTITDVAIQNDGKILIAGYAVTNTDKVNAIIARLNPDGNFDGTFGYAGKVIEDLGYTDQRFYAVKIQNDGRIVVAGNADDRLVVARYTTEGTRDSSFASGGFATIRITLRSSAAYALAIQNDGRIIAAGKSGSDFLVARYNSNGTADSSFDGDGRLLTNFSFHDAQINSLAAKADGTIIAAGKSFTSSHSHFAIAMYSSTGSLLRKVETQYASDENNEFYCVALQADGKFIAGGINNRNCALIRYNSDGSLDSSFGSNGLISEFVAGDSRMYCLFKDIAVQPDGKIVAIGGWLHLLDNDFIVIRYLPGGARDAEFGTGGMINNNFSDIIASGAQGTDGMIVAAGKHSPSSLSAIRLWN